MKHYADRDSAGQAMKSGNFKKDPNYKLKQNAASLYDLFRLEIAGGHKWVHQSTTRGLDRSVDI